MTLPKAQGQRISTSESIASSTNVNSISLLNLSILFLSTSDIKRIQSSLYSNCAKGYPTFPIP